MGDYQAELKNLLETTPTRDKVTMPVTTREQVLPLHELRWQRFEQLCARLVASEHDIVDCHRYGVSGEAQGGVDIMAYRQTFREGLRELWCYQCKRWREMTPGDLRRIVEKFTYPAEHYVVIISLQAGRALRDVVAERPDVDLWDAEDISRRLKDLPELVEDFFGPHWRDAFCGGPPFGSGEFERPREAPYLHWVIGRDAEKRDLLELWAGVRRKGRGSTVFLMGQQGCGRRALVEWIRSRVEEEGGSAAALGFWDPGTLSAEEVGRFYWADPVVQEYGPKLAESFPKRSRTIGGGPWVSLAVRLLELLEEAGKLDRAPLDAPDDPRVLNQLVRKAARCGPLLVIVEYLDWGDSLWIDLLGELADEISQDLPVLLLVTLKGAAAVDKLSKRQHTEPTRLVEELVRRGLAQSYYLGSVTADEITRSIGHADPELGERLHYLAEGDPLTVQIIWEEWVEQGAVVQDGAGMWCVSPSRDGEWWVYGDVRDHARSLLGDLLEGWEESLPFSAGQAERILNCAAVEGETFTAAAVAKVMGVGTDELIDFFDDWLVEEAESEGEGEGEADEGVEGILADEGFVEIDSQRSLCQYRFARPYLYHVWAKYPRDEEQRRVWSGQLADELERLYYPLGYLIAEKLYDLFEAGGLRERAEPYRRRRAVESSLEALLWHVQFLIETTSEGDWFGTYRLFDRGFELLYRLVTERPELWEEGYRIAHVLERRAVGVGDVGRQADARFIMAWHLSNGGRYTEALAAARQAVELYEESSGARSPGAARALGMLGCVLQNLGDPAGAWACCERALAIDERIFGPDHPNVARDVNDLGLVLRDLGDLAGARAAFERALEIDERVYGPEHPNVAIRVNNLGSVLRDQGDLAGARGCFERALGIFEQVLGPEHPNVATLVNNLGNVLRDQGDLAGARGFYERALAIREAALGRDHPDTALSLWWLGTLERETGDAQQARAYFEEALRVFERVYPLGHPHIEGVRADLESLEDQ